jgi:hypothetical protein
MLQGKLVQKSGCRRLLSSQHRQEGRGHHEPVSVPVYGIDSHISPSLIVV